MSLPPSEFAVTFRDIVVPRIKRVLIDQGAALAAGESYTQCLAVVMAEAGRLGAWHLPKPHLDAFEEWASATLLRECDEAERLSIVAGDLVRSLLRARTQQVMRDEIRNFIHGG